MQITLQNYKTIISEASNFKDVSGVFIGLPCYNASMNCLFVQSLISLLGCLGALHIPFTMMIVGSESLITRGRNLIANAFYYEAKQFNRLLLIDSDLQFRPEDILVMLASGKDLIALPYAQKSFDWQRVSNAVKAGCPVEALPAQASDPVVNFLPDGPRHAKGILEVESAGCGAMLLSRHALEKLAASYGGERRYKLFEPQIKALKQQGSDRTEALEFFWNGINDGNVYISEDYALCEDWRKVGGQVYCVPWASTRHHGLFPYECNLALTHYTEAQ